MTNRCFIIKDLRKNNNIWLLYCPYLCCLIFCTIVWSFWMKANLFGFLLFVCVLPLDPSNKATLIQSWSHRYTNTTIVITIRLTVTKYLKWQWFFYFLRRWFFLLSPSRPLPNLTKNIWVRTRVHPGFLVGGVRVANYFCVVLLCVFTFWVPCCNVRYDFHIETMFSSSLRPVVLGEFMSFLFCFSSSCVPYVFSFSGLSIFDCTFGIL